VVFEDGVPTTREVDRLSADVETLCSDWRRMRAIVQRIATAPWWDLHTLSCLYCHAPFEVAGGECKHEVDCVYDSCCDIVGAKPLPLPDRGELA
jgi:hypothetical protein